MKDVCEYYKQVMEEVEHGNLKSNHFSPNNFQIIIAFDQPNNNSINGLLEVIHHKRGYFFSKMTSPL
jgi:hypothetical protein